MWNTESGKRLNTLKIKEKMDSPLEFVMDNYKLIVVVENGIEIWNLESNNGPAVVLYVGKTRSLHLVGDSVLCYSRLFLDSASWKLIDCSNNHPTQPILVTVLTENGNFSEHSILAHNIVEFAAKLISCNEFQVIARQVYEKDQNIVVYAFIRYASKDSLKINPYAAYIPKIDYLPRRYVIEGYWAKKTRLLSVPYPLPQNEPDKWQVQGPVTFYCERYANDRGWIPSDCNMALVKEFMD